MAMGDETKVRWRDLTGSERLGLIEQVQQGRISQAELCRTFGMSRQVLHKAIRTAAEAAEQALERKRPGRKPPSESDEKIKELEQQLRQKERDLKRLAQKLEVTQTLMELERKLDRGETLPGEKKRRKRK
jgi:transposase-like protein